MSEKEKKHRAFYEAYLKMMDVIEPSLDRFEIEAPLWMIEQFDAFIKEEAFDLNIGGF